MSERSERRFRVFVLGAGFSAAAGLPLAPELWAEIRRRARTLTGRAEKFQRDLEAYLEFKRLCDGKEDLKEDQVDFEDFMRVLDIEHFLALRGSDTWSVDGNESTMMVKWLLGEILTEHTPSPEEIPEAYLEFASDLAPGDLVLSFNYDILLERALDRVGKAYRLFPYRSQSFDDNGLPVEDPRDREEVLLLKLHGSLDWFDRSQHSALEEEFRRQGSDSGPTHRVFSHMTELAVSKIDDGKRAQDDAFAQMYRVGNVDQLYEKGLSFLCAPWLLAPSTVKIIYAERLRDFWYGLAKGGFLNFGMAVVGYSMPPQDEYARQAIYTLVRNYQESDGWEEEVFGLRKSPLVLVDLCPDDASLQRFRDRYRFINWDRARLIRSGFDSEAVAAMFCVQ